MKDWTPTDELRIKKYTNTKGVLERKWEAEYWDGDGIWTKHEWRAEDTSPSILMSIPDISFEEFLDDYYDGEAHFYPYTADMRNVWEYQQSIIDLLKRLHNSAG